MAKKQLTLVSWSGIAKELFFLIWQSCFLFDFWILAVSTLAPSMTKRNVLRWIRETSREFFKNKIKILHNPIEVNSSNLSTFYFTNFFKVLKIHFSLQIFPHSISQIFLSFENSLFSERIKKKTIKAMIQIPSMVLG